MAKINGNLPWVLALGISMMGWAYSLGWQSRSLKDCEIRIEKKADSKLVNIQLRFINEKLDTLLKNRGLK